MGRVVSTDLAAQHLRLDDALDEGELLEMYIEAAEEHVESYLRRPLLPWSAAVPDSVPPTPVKQAILLVLGDLYQHRASQTSGALAENRTLTNLLAPHRRGLGL